MPCQILIMGIQAGPPYANGDEPVTVTVPAHCTSDCQEARVIVRATGPGSALIGSSVVAVTNSGAADFGPQLPGLISADFALPSVGLKCGDSLFVEVISMQDAACRDSGVFRIGCKPEPGGGPNGDPWPPSRCFFAAAGAAMMLLAALTSIALGIGLPDGATLAVGTALLAAVAVAWALWKFWCAPSVCVQVGVLCWVFKRAFLAAIPVVGFSHNLTIILVLVAYGSIAGILVHRLRGLRCPIPSAKLPITQIPI